MFRLHQLCVLIDAMVDVGFDEAYIAEYSEVKAMVKAKVCYLNISMETYLWNDM